jgi:hypothetical protein
VTHHLPARPTRLVEPGFHTDPRPHPGCGGLLDIRTLPLEPIPVELRHLAVSTVGARLGTEFDGLEITDPDNALPGAVLITYAPTNPPGDCPGLVAVAVLLPLAGQIHPDAVAVWPALDVAWPEIVRTSVIFAARHQGRSPR